MHQTTTVLALKVRQRRLVGNRLASSHVVATAAGTREARTVEICARGLTRA